MWLLPEWQEPGPVEQGADGPVHDLPVHGLGGGGEVRVVLGGFIVDLIHESMHLILNLTRLLEHVFRDSVSLL